MHKYMLLSTFLAICCFFSNVCAYEEGVYILVNDPSKKHMTVFMVPREKLDSIMDCSMPIPLPVADILFRGWRKKYSESRYQPRKKSKDWFEG